MPQIKILNRDYNVACGAGEEQKLLDLAAKLDKRLQENARLFRGANDMMVFILTALTLEDMAQDLSQQNNVLQQKLSQGIKGDDDSEYLLNSLAERIENFTKNLK